MGSGERRMKTKYNVGDVVYIKAVVENVSIYANKKGNVITEYCVKAPEVAERVADKVYLKEENVYADTELVMLNISKPERIPKTPARGTHGFRVGQYIIYRDGERYELGRIKEFTKDGAFVSYTEGTGGSLTLFSDMHPLFNEYCIKDTTLGGEDK